jgi:uncharacterized protein (DUF1810 family)
VVLGWIDARTLRSSMTLFEVAGGGADLGAVLDRWFAGERDAATIELLSAAR